MTAEDAAAAWMRHMRDGRWDQGWRIADAVLKRRHWSDRSLPRHQQSIWDGSPVAGRRVLLRCYHGLGDTIQFIRYAPLLASEATELAVWAQPTLLPLLRTMRMQASWLPLDDGEPAWRYDVDLESMELPHLFRTTLETLPRRVPYLHPPRRAVPRECGGLSVGLVWRAGDWNPRRSLPTHLLAPLGLVQNVEWHLLQRGPAADDRPRFGADAGSDDVLHTAGTMTNLDLVVSVDSFPAHLAGALGVPTWVMLPYDADWRWMRQSRSPWYPTMRLFRQRREGDWTDVIERVVTALRLLARGTYAGRRNQ
jgi:hypothetical protein